MRLDLEKFASALQRGICVWSLNRKVSLTAEVGYTNDSAAGFVFASGLKVPGGRQSNYMFTHRRFLLCDFISVGVVVLRVQRICPLLFGNRFASSELGSWRRQRPRLLTIAVAPFVRDEGTEDRSDREQVSEARLRSVCLQERTPQGRVESRRWIRFFLKMEIA